MPDAWCREENVKGYVQYLFYTVSFLTALVVRKIHKFTCKSAQSDQSSSLIQKVCILQTKGNVGNLLRLHNIAG